MKDKKKLSEKVDEDKVVEPVDTFEQDKAILEYYEKNFASNGNAKVINHTKDGKEEIVSIEEIQNEVEANQQNLELKKSLQETTLEQSSQIKTNTKNKKTNELGYKPKFTETFAFKAIIIFSVLFVFLTVWAIYSLINNAPPKNPAGYIFEVRTGEAGDFTEKDGLYSFNGSLSSNFVEVRIKFKGNFKGNIEVSLSNTSIANLNKTTIANGEIVRIVPNKLSNDEVIGGQTSIIAKYNAIIGKLDILVDKRVSGIEINEPILDAKDVEGFANLHQTPKLYVGRQASLKATIKMGESNISDGDDFKRVVEWSSLNPDIAQVDEFGNITPFKSGNVVFHAKTNEFYNSSKIVESNSQAVQIYDVPYTNVKCNLDELNKNLYLSNDLDVNMQTIITAFNVNLTLVPSDFSADYLKDIAILNERVVSGQKAKIEIKDGANGFVLKDSTKTDDGKKVVFDISINKVLLSEENANNVLTVNVIRDKDVKLIISDEKQQKEVSYLTYINEGIKTQYTKIDLFNLFTLRIDKTSESNGKNHNFDKDDVIFEATSEKYTLEKDLQGKWFFVPKQISNPEVTEEVFIVYAYLIDVNKENAVIGTKIPLHIRVVPPTVNLNVSNMSTVTSGDDLYTKIFDSIGDSHSQIYFTFDSSSRFGLSKNILFNNNKVEAHKIYVELIADKPAELEIVDKTKVVLKNEAELTQFVSISFKYQYADGRIVELFNQKQFRIMF